MRERTDLQNIPVATVIDGKKFHYSGWHRRDLELLLRNTETFNKSPQFRKRRDVTQGIREWAAKRVIILQRQNKFRLQSTDCQGFTTAT